ncbi:hypothetical protein BN946_scf184709.g5 [Trametes cinnabarina]|uniref:PH domain-containing protein n=1 Tax=Pycnoporus cinnabarinus TaxID=5643 RepID=A0A060SWR2_PYCCI|nr:hypothetical protein BN946_scf184709.g5 [Trametes cinnabarina]
MSASVPLRDRLQSNSPEPDPSRPTTPLRIHKQRDSPQPEQKPLSPRHALSPPRRQGAPLIARRTSSSYKHVRENQLVTKSPFRSLLPQPSPRRVSGEKRPRPVSMTSQAENEHPLGFKRRQSKGFQGLLQKEPVTKSPFRHGSDGTSSEEQPPPVPPKPRQQMSAQSSNSSPTKPSLVTRRLHGPRDAGGRRQRRKTVTWDSRMDVVEFDVSENAMDDVFYSEDDYGVPSDEEDGRQDSYEFDDSSRIMDDSILGEVEHMLEDVRPQTPPRPDEDGDVELLPPSPSPSKKRPEVNVPPHASPPGIREPDAPADDPHEMSHIKDENPPFNRDESYSSIRSNESDSLDPSNLSIGNSEVSLSNLDGQSFIVDASNPVDDSLISHSSFAPQAGSSPPGRPLSRSRSATPLDQSFEQSRDRSLEARSTPCINGARYNSPRPGSASGSRSGSPCHRLFRPSSTSSLGDVGRRSSPFITPEGVQQRMQRKSQEGSNAIDRTASRSPAHSLTPPVVEAPRPSRSPNVPEEHQVDDVNKSAATDVENELPTTTRSDMMLPLMARGQNPTHDGVMSIDPEPQPIDPPRPTLTARANSIDIIGTGASEGTPMDAKRAFEGLELDFEHGFGLGEEGMSVSAGLGMRSMTRHMGPSPGADFAPGLGRAKSPPVPEAIQRAGVRRSSMYFGDRSALDKLVEDMAQNAELDPLAEISLLSESEAGEQSFHSLRVEEVTEGVKASTFTLPDIVRDEEDMNIDVDEAAVRPSTPEGGWRAAGARAMESVEVASAKPAVNAIRAREELIKAKKREARRLEDDSDDDVPLGRRIPARATTTETDTPGMLHPNAAGSGRPTRRRSMSTGDAEEILNRSPGASRRAAALQRDGLLDITALRGGEDPLADSINRELKKLEAPKRSQKYHVREHSETIYASADGDRISHMGGAGDVDAGKAWRTLRRPSDINEYAKQIRELRAQAKSGKAHGKVFVRVLGLKTIQVPIPREPTAITCTLNNGIHFVTTPETALGTECRIDQEFELIEHTKLEFTLTIKVRRDPHIIAQLKANQPPPAPRPAPQPLPPPASKGGNSKGGGMRSFLGLGSPKKPKAAPRPVSPAPPPPPPRFELKENLARYMKPDGSLARAFISFKDVAPLCDTRLLETAFPLIGQRLENGSSAKAMQIGQIVLQIFRLPPLPGIPPNQLPQSLEECHRGLSHVRWHKATYQQGTLTQNGGDCATWRRRHFRVIGANMVAFNDVTKRAIATIDLRKAISVEDDHTPVLSPASGKTARSHFDDDRTYGVERSFRLVFGPSADQEIIFFADTDAEKSRW